MGYSQMTTAGGVAASSASKTKLVGNSNNEVELMDSSNFRCMALCEIINDSGIKRATNSIWTVADEKNVCTRFFFVYTGAAARQGLTADTTSPAFQAEIKKAMDANDLN